MKTILLVEDEPMLLALIAQRLQDEGYRLLLAEGGPQALTLIAAQPEIDLLITDMNMPKVNGIAVARAFREKFKANRIGILSGHFDVNDTLSNCPDLCDATVLAKPLPFSELLAWIQG